MCYMVDQSIILFEELSLKEHLEVFYSLKLLQGGQKKEENYKEFQFQKIVYLLELEKYQDVALKFLSQGLQRKIQIGIAFINPMNRLVVIDEPCQGYMDHISRQQLYSLFQIFKRKKIIIVSTNDPLEAEYMGDRISVIKNGKQLTCGN